MKVKSTEIPVTAIAAGQSAMVDSFRAMDVQKAVSASLRGNRDFTYPISDPRVAYMWDTTTAAARRVIERARDTFDMRVADHLIQVARRKGHIAFKGGRWALIG